MSPKRQPAKKVTKPPSARKTPVAAKPSRARKKTAGTRKNELPPTLRIKSFGPIGDVNVEFGDLTVLVGPQATGKSIFLQMLKLVVDSAPVAETLWRNGQVYREAGDFFDLYFGEGYARECGEKSQFTWNNEHMPLTDAIPDPYPYAKEFEDYLRQDKCEYVPAHRALVLHNGWPKAFHAYESRDPYSLRNFSDSLFTNCNVSEYRLAINSDLISTPGNYANILLDYSPRIEVANSRKRLVLQRGKDALPMLSWSTGQREFVPLLLAVQFQLQRDMNLFSQIYPSEWFVVEEPELGLHPQGIMAVMLLLCEVLGTGRRVVISTHSPRVLDYVWALRFLQTRGGKPEDVLALFEQEPTELLLQLAVKLLKKSTRVYHFDGHPSHSEDISELDPFSENEAVAGWGGLLSSNSRIVDVVTAVANRSSST